MTTIILPKTHHVRLGAVTERLKERLAEIKIAHKAKVDVGSSWEKGFDEALAAEIHFLTGLLDALEKS